MDGTPCSPLSGASCRTTAGLRHLKGLTPFPWPVGAGRILVGSTNRTKGGRTSSGTKRGDDGGVGEYIAADGRKLPLSYQWGKESWHTITNLSLSHVPIDLTPTLTHVLGFF